MQATPKASDVTDHRGANSIPHLPQTDTMVTNKSTCKFQDKTQTEEPNLTSNKYNNISHTVTLTLSVSINFKAMNSTLSPSATAVTSGSTGSQSNSATGDTVLDVSSSTFGGSTEKSQSVIRSVPVTEMITTPEKVTSPAIVNMRSPLTRKSTYTPHYMSSAGSQNFYSTHQTSLYNEINVTQGQNSESIQTPEKQTIEPHTVQSSSLAVSGSTATFNQKNLYMMNLTSAANQGTPFITTVSTATSDTTVTETMEFNTETPTKTTSVETEPTKTLTQPTNSEAEQSTKVVATKLITLPAQNAVSVTSVCYNTSTNTSICGKINTSYHFITKTNF